MLSSPLLQDEDFKEQHPDDYEAFLSDPNTTPQMIREVSPGGGSVPSALEEMDNLLRIYRTLDDDEQRAGVYLDFWVKYHEIVDKQPHLLLHIPPRVRGYLASMADVEMTQRPKLSF